jgi:hypothetical protein
MWTAAERKPNERRAGGASLPRRELSMALSRWVLRLASVTLPASLMIGCAAPPPAAPAAAPAPPATSNDVSHVQMELQQHDKGAVAGSVIKILSASHLAAVVLASQHNASMVRVDDAFTFTDSNQNPIANGKVVSVDQGIVVVSYVPATGGREPSVGDIAIHLSGL